MRSLFISLFITFLLTNSSQAYLDPISGSFIIQSIVAIFGGIVVFWRKIKNFFLKKIFRKKDASNNSEKKEDL